MDRNKAPKINVTLEAHDLEKVDEINRLERKIINNSKIQEDMRQRVKRFTTWRKIHNIAMKHKKSSQNNDL